MSSSSSVATFCFHLCFMIWPSSCLVSLQTRSSEYLEPLRNRQSVAIQLRSCLLYKSFSALFLVTIRVFCAFLDWMYSFFDSYRSSSLNRSYLGSYSSFSLMFPLCPGLSGVSVHSITTSSPFHRLYSDLCDLLRLHLLWTRSYLPIVDPGISSKHTFWYATSVWCSLRSSIGIL